MSRSKFQFMGEEGSPPSTTKQFSRHQLGVLQFSSILTGFTQKEHQIQQVKGSLLQESPTPSTSDANCNSRLLPVLLIDWHKSEVPTTLSFCSIKLLEQPTEFKHFAY